MLYLPVYLLYLLLPGFLVTRLLGVGGPSLVLSFGLSYALLVLTATLLRAFDPGFEALAVAVHAEILLLLAVAWTRRTPVIRRAWGGRRAERCVLGALALAVPGAYLLWAGPYLEMPADAWYHLAELREQFGVLAGVQDPRPVALGRMLDHGAPVDHVVPAFVLHVAALRPYEALGTMAFTHGMMFIAAIYVFALYLFRTKRLAARARVLVAAFAALFFLLHFGTGIFSYVRYYNFAPAISTFIVYLAAVALLIRIIEEGAPLAREGALVALMAVAAALAHRQEALFIGIMAGAMLLAAVAAGSVRRRRADIAPDVSWSQGVMRRNAWLLALWLAGYGAVHGLALWLAPRNAGEGVLVLPWFQFYGVVTPWGLAVAALFLAYWRHFLGSTYLVAAMLSALLTVYNPLFVDLFLRLSWPEVGWRLLFLLPLPFVAAYAMVDLLRRIAGPGPRWRRAAAALPVAALCVLWLPVDRALPGPPVSRLATLAPVAPGRDHRQWADVWEYLRNYSDRFILTDPVTGYAANAVTDNRNRGFKFYASNQRFPLDGVSYSRADFRHKGGWLLVINKRSGLDSVNGRSSGHWPADVMDLEQYYSPEFEQFVSGNPDLFVEVWTRDRVSVYEIRPG
jgi:hypothetical protein